MSNPATKQLEAMLSYKRCAGTQSERQFIKRYIAPLPEVQFDPMGNYYLAVGSGAPTTIISCHTDTMHRNVGRQQLARKGSVLYLADQQRGDVLGADDGAGVYIALRMIEAKIPALYVFHRAEEKGGLGSDFISRCRPKLLAGIQRAIAFDRRGQQDIITHQMMGRCCSDEFAYELSAQLDMGHLPCPYGTFTDTANYTQQVPECTNIAVGYMLEHTHRESLDTDYLLELTEQVLKVDWNALPTLRDVNDLDYDFTVELTHEQDANWGTTGVRSSIQEKDLLSWEELELRDRDTPEDEYWNPRGWGQGREKDYLKGNS